MLAPPKRQSAGGSVHSEQGPAPDSASVRRVRVQIESFRDAMSRDSSLGIPFNKFFSICGNYDSVIYGRALRGARSRFDAACPSIITFPRWTIRFALFFNRVGSAIS